MIFIILDHKHAIVETSTNPSEIVEKFHSSGGYAIFVYDEDSPIYESCRKLPNHTYFDVDKFSDKYDPNPKNVKVVITGNTDEFIWYEKGEEFVVNECDFYSQLANIEGVSNLPMEALYIVQRGEHKGSAILKKDCKVI